MPEKNVARVARGDRPVYQLWRWPEIQRNCSEEGNSGCQNINKL